MYSKEDYKRDLKWNERNIKQFKPVLIFIIIFSIISFILFIVGLIIENHILYASGVCFLVIGLILIAIISIGNIVTKKELEKMKQGEDKYIQYRRNEEIKIMKEEMRKKRNKRNKKTSPSRTLEEDIDEYMLFDEIFDD